MKLDIGNISNRDFHIHANYTDGEQSVQEIVDQALKCGYEAIGIVEHIRIKPNYNWLGFLDEAEDAKKEYRGQLKIYTGFEAKVIDFDGMLDIRNYPRSCIDILIGSLHTLPGHMTVYDAYESLLESDCDIIGHPVGFPDSLIPKLVKSGKYYEINYKYGVNEQRVRDIVVQGGKIIHGSDAHEWRQFPIRARLRKKLSNLYNAP